MKNRLRSLVVHLLWLAATDAARAQGTAFTYQGRLNDNGSPASGNYELQFYLRDALTAGNPVGTTNTLAPVILSNGLFTVSLDFGAGVFTGTNYWLEIGVRTNGSAAAFGTLSPRQPLSAVPYALYAMTPAGPQGDAGTNGTNGVNGTNGLNGATGPQGPIGLTGATGAQGPQGDAGINGTNGVNGINGTNGATGPQGPAGPLLPNVALIDTNQTYTGTNVFTGVVIQTNTANTFAGSGAGLTVLNPANLSAGTAGINISGNAATANAVTGSLAGDVTGTQGATVVSSVGGQTAGAVAFAAGSANAATSANSPVTLVKRDPSGNFSAGTITANLAGNASTALTADLLDGLDSTAFAPASGSSVYVAKAGDTMAGALKVSQNPRPQLVIEQPSGGGGAALDLKGFNNNGSRTWRLSTDVAFVGDFGILVSPTTGGNPTSNILSILASGAVGIGKNNPAYALDVNGTVNATAFARNGTPLISSQWTTSGTNIFYTGGKVGIGTVSPLGTLDVVGVNGARMMFEFNEGELFVSGKTNGGNARLQLSGSSGWGSFASYSGGGRLWLSGVSGVENFPIASGQYFIRDNIAGATRLIIDASGNVGIGTSSPAAALHVNGTVQATAFSGSGASLAGLNASQLTDGTLNDMRLSTNVAVLNANQTFSGSNVFAGMISATNSTNKLAGSFTGDGAGLTNLSVPVAGLVGTLATGQLPSLDASQIASGTFGAAQIPNLDAVKIISGTISDARLSANVARLNSGATFNGSVTANSFIGNGAGITNLPGFSWQTVSGTSQQAQPNKGYILQNDALTTITLPNAPAIGDVVRVSGGAAGWTIAQNDGQSVLPIPFAGFFTNWNALLTNWTVQLGLGGDGFASIACSADGTKWVAVTWGGVSYNQAGERMAFYTGFDGFGWTSIASSSDGNKLVVAESGGGIYTSTNAGLTATQTSAPTNYWSTVASSTNGVKLVAVADSIYTSANSGGTWTKTSAVSNSWSGVASSADGVRLFAVSFSNLAGDPGSIYTSANSGSTWTKTSAPSNNWETVACSADGTKVLAGIGGGDGGPVYTSVNSGTSWTTTSPAGNWTSVASSADGKRFVAVERFTPRSIIISTNSGTNWVQTSAPFKQWYCVASSADGRTLLAGTQGGSTDYVYRAHANPLPITTTPGILGYMTGTPYSAIELQYVGSGRFIPLSHEGTIDRF